MEKKTYNWIIFFYSTLPSIIRDFRLNSNYYYTLKILIKWKVLLQKNTAYVAQIYRINSVPGRNFLFCEVELTHYFLEGEFFYSMKYSHFNIGHKTDLHKINCAKLVLHTNYHLFETVFIFCCRVSKIRLAFLYFLSIQSFALSASSFRYSLK